MPETIVSQLHKALRRLVIATGVLYILVLGTVCYIGYALNAGIGDQADRLTSALCNQRNDQLERVKQTNAFLADHPNGGFGFTRAQIIDSRTRAENNIKALQPLNCG